MPSKIDILLAKSREEYFLSEQEARYYIIKGYLKTLKEIESIIEDMYIKYGDTPTITQLYKLNRLSKIEQDIAKELGGLNIKVKNHIGSGITSVFEHGYYSTGFSVEVGSGVSLGFQGLNKEAIKFVAKDNLWQDALSQNTSKLLTDTKREFEMVLRANAREEVISGVAQGKSLAQVKKAIKDRFSVSAKRAEVIARTELHKSYMKGSVMAMNEAVSAAEQLGMEAQKIWQHNGIGKPRYDHLEADGQVADKDGMFTVGGEYLEGPGLGSDPANNINCHCTVGFDIAGTGEYKTEDITKIKNIEEWRDVNHF